MVLAHVFEMCFALFGAGFALVVNADYYAEACLPHAARMLLVLAGMAAAIITVVLAGGGGGWMRFTSLSVYWVLCLHGLLAVFEAHHRVSVALLALACAFVMRRRGAVYASLAAAVALAAAVVINHASPLHARTREPVCEHHAPAVLGLLAAGAVHAFPAAVVFSVSHDGSQPPLLAFAVAVFLHVLPLTVLRGAIPVMLHAPYTDMLVGGVSAREAATLVVQACALLAAGSAALWHMLFVLHAAGAAQPAPYFVSVLIGAVAAFFLLNFAFGVLAVVVFGLAGAMLAQFALL
jgi:hypothetical protein